METLYMMKNLQISALILLCALLFPVLNAVPAGSTKDDRPVIGVQQKDDIKVVFQMTSGESAQGVSKILTILNSTYLNYIEEGVLPENIVIRAVIHGDAADHLLTDAAWNKYKQQATGNPSTELIEILNAKGIHLELCNSRRTQNGWEKSDIHPSVVLVGNAYHRLADLQFSGYAYIRP